MLMEPINTALLFGVILLDLTKCYGINSDHDTGHFIGVVSCSQQFIQFYSCSSRL